MLTERSDEDARFMLFERINTGSTLLKDIDKEKRAYAGDFTKFANECAKKLLFR